jgi:hypothetical protein
VVAGVNPSEAQIEAAARALYAEIHPVIASPPFPHKDAVGPCTHCYYLARAALTAAALAVPEVVTEGEGDSVVGLVYRINALTTENERLGEVAKHAESILNWIASLPSLGAVTEGCNTEANQVHATPEQSWHVKSSETQRHWLDHVGPAIRAAYGWDRQQQDYPGSSLSKLVSALMAHWTDGEHAFNPNTGKCRCGNEWLCDMSSPHGMCPHCGREVGVTDGLTRWHMENPPLIRGCPGSNQNARNADSDARPLWNGKRNERFRG